MYDKPTDFCSQLIFPAKTMSRNSIGQTKGKKSFHLCTKHAYHTPPLRIVVGIGINELAGHGQSRVYHIIYLVISILV